MEDKIELLIKLGTLDELIGKCKELVQGEGLVGGHRGYVDQSLTDASNAVYTALEELKSGMIE